jgi:hypothetical protein
MFKPRQTAIPIYATLHKGVYHKVVGLSMNNETERIRMKQLYPIFEVCPSTSGGTEEYHEPAQQVVRRLRFKQGTF